MSSETGSRPERPSTSAGSSRPNAGSEANSSSQNPLGTATKAIELEDSKRALNGDLLNAVPLLMRNHVGHSMEQYYPDHDDDEYGTPAEIENFHLRIKNTEKKFGKLREVVLEGLKETRRVNIGFDILRFLPRHIAEGDSYAQELRGQIGKDFKESTEEIVKLLAEGKAG